MKRVLINKWIHFKLFRSAFFNCPFNLIFSFRFCGTNASCATEKSGEPGHIFNETTQSISRGRCSGSGRKLAACITTDEPGIKLYCLSRKNIWVPEAELVTTFCPLITAGGERKLDGSYLAAGHPPLLLPSPVMFLKWSSNPTRRSWSGHILYPVPSFHWMWSGFSRRPAKVPYDDKPGRGLRIFYSRWLIASRFMFH